jgi:hypothetical protein
MIAMTTNELKKELIHRIAGIDDKNFLNALKIILDAKSESSELVLTSEQKSEILQSKKEIEEGLYFEQAEIDKIIGEWLKEK